MARSEVRMEPVLVSEQHLRLAVALADARLLFDSALWDLTDAARRLEDAIDEHVAPAQQVTNLGQVQAQLIESATAAHLCYQMSLIGGLPEPQAKAIFAGAPVEAYESE